MALTPSTMLPLGTPAPDFSLPNTNAEHGSNTVSLADYADAKVLVVVFMCNHCPYVVHVRNTLAQLGKDLAAKDCALVGISSNDVTTHPQDGPSYMTSEAQKSGYTFAYLYDETQDVARAYDAACTPDFYVFDQERRLAYRGQLDDSRPGNRVPSTGEDVRAAVDALLRGEQPSADQKPSMGCNIKWRG